MPQTTSHIRTNFDQKWTGLKVHIATPEKTTVEWTLSQKIYERERTSDHHGKEARAIFRCTDADNKKCIIKVRMLLDWKHLHTSPFLTYIETEIQALGKLTEKNCQSTPRFYGSMMCIQNIPDPSPGAVTSFIAMEDVPGRLYDWSGYWSNTTVFERAQKRAAFRKAFHDCFECGYWNLDAGLRNLVFDDDNDKCYVIDWEVAVPASAGAVKWNGLMYGMWEMIKYNRANPEDFTQWEW
ncbi:Hypothetical protein PENO1_010080 [Penicillium occitanis (nom. inval.)]|nr:Hypothetical protein PENO1_010080 [Penicillium occitanis (nom. inval.)]PCH09845.1 hypothetical protein PENOC_007290 [Penicillium occitanis (nom. inval.)]